MDKRKNTSKNKEKDAKIQQDEKINQEEVQAENKETSAAGVSEQEKKELQDKYLRLYAEFTNYRKRVMKERLELIDQAAKDTLAAILPVLDDFDRAKQAAENSGQGDAFSDGVGLIYHKLQSILEQKGLKPMKSNGEKFDPEFHEAITEIPAPSDDMKGKVIDTVEKGYFLKDNILRYAKVVVGK